MVSHKAHIGSLLIVKLVNVHSQVVHTQPKLRAFLVLDLEIGYAVHLEVLGNVQVVGHGLITIGLVKVSMHQYSNGGVVLSLAHACLMRSSHCSMPMAC